MLSFKHEVFLEVARQLSFTKASQVLFISQPAISKHIHQLEEQYNTSLFERKGGSICSLRRASFYLTLLPKQKQLKNNWTTRSVLTAIIDM